MTLFLSKLGLDRPRNWKKKISSWIPLLPDTGFKIPKKKRAKKIKKLHSGIISIQTGLG